ncbi:MAG: integrase arm-type DNA-binding domain-containing protein [Gammaproteobacteria bacterium]|nr:integrase arm-type DNA-binding domain-containing protein [Gammaproteobacteria bacterium]
MPITRLTDAAVQRLKATQSGRLEYFDAGLPAFGVRVSQTGRKSWILFYRYRGKQRRLTLGTYPNKSLADAREAAHQAQKKIEQGIDPGDEKAALRAAERARQNDFKAVATEFIEKYAKRHTRSWKETDYTLRKEVIPAWGDLNIRKITRADVLDLGDGIIERGKPYMANRTHAAIRKLFNWAVERGIVDASPVAGVKPPGKEHSRDRTLTDDEIKAIWDAAETLGYPFGAMYRMLMLTGQRLNEVASMQWQHVRGDVWRIPTTKNDEPHEVPLALAAMNVLNGLPKVAGPYVFSTTAGQKPVSGFSRAKADMDRMSGVTGWRNHDLRRTLSTNMARLGIPPHVTEKVLNHRPS